LGAGIGIVIATVILLSDTLGLFTLIRGQFNRHSIRVYLQWRYDFCADFPGGGGRSCGARESSL
jgi:hypothetical protein